MTVAQTNTYNGNVKGTKMNYNFATASNSSIPLFSKETVYGYQYDRINRLVNADALVGDIIDAQFANTSNLNPSESYSIGDEFWRYDRIGNIIIQDRVKPGAAVNLGSLIDEFTYTYANGTNRLTKVEDLIAVTARNYTYDANGNLLTDDFRDIDATVYMRGSYPFQVTQSSDNSYYLYDGGDQRIYKKVVTSAQTTQEMYIKDALGRDLSIMKFTTVGSTTTSATEYFVYGTDRVARVTVSTTTPLAKIQPDEATYFLYDHLGNTRVAFSVDASNVPLIVNAMDYYSYGKILREYDNGTDGGDRYLTTGHERDQKTGLDYRGARYYDADIARFLSTDPWEDKYPNWSTYNYVMGNPISLTDPSGNGPEDPAEERKTPEKSESEKPGMRTVNFGLFSLHFRKSRYAKHPGIVKVGIDFSWNYTFAKVAKTKTKDYTEKYQIDAMTRGGVQATSIAPINYPLTTVGTATRRRGGGGTLNNLFNTLISNGVTPVITRATLKTHGNDVGGTSTYVFFVGNITINNQNNFNPTTNVLNAQQINVNTPISGSLVQQTPAPDGSFDQCNGYKFTVTVQYKITQTVNRTRLVRRAPN
jgi:RHS repeat-associated protein